MDQDERILLDLDKVTHYKKLPDKSRKIIISICVFIFLVVSFSNMKGCLTRPKKVQIQPRPVQTGLVVKKDAPIYIESFGTLCPIYDVDIQAQVTGEIMEAHFDEGDEVKKGDLLFTIDPRLYKADLDKTEATLAEDLVDLKLKADILARNTLLVEKDLVSKQDYEQYQTDVAVLEAKILMDKADIEQAAVNLDYCYIKSPINGLTGKRQVDPGNIVTANTGPVLVNIKTVDPFYIDFTIPERDLSRLRDAMSKNKLDVKIKMEGEDKFAYKGELEFLDNSVSDTTGTVALRAVVQNKERKLWAGQFVRVRLVLDIQKDAVLAPYQAVRIGQKGEYLFAVTEDDKADLRLIKTGDREDDFIIINEGVSAGEKVVTVGQLGLSPGAPVVDVTDKGKGK